MWKEYGCNAGISKPIIKDKYIDTLSVIGLLK
jgi:hypothetical protein